MGGLRQVRPTVCRARTAKGHVSFIFYPVFQIAKKQKEILADLEKERQAKEGQKEEVVPIAVKVGTTEKGEDIVVEAVTLHFLDIPC